MKKILPYLIALLLGILLTSIIISLNIWGTKSQVKLSYAEYADSLITHFPENYGISDVTVSKLPFPSRQKLGWESVVLIIPENDKILEFVEYYESKSNLDTIVTEDIFNIEIDIKDYCLTSESADSLSKYPFPDKIEKDSFEDFELIFYEFSILQNIDSLSEISNHISDKWKHGVSRGIARESNGDYYFWLMIW